MAEQLPPDVVADLAEVGIYSPDPSDELHRRLVETLLRTRGMSRGSRLVAMQWVFGWDMGRQGREFAQAKSAYEVEQAKAVIRFRDQGEKSGAMCEKRAEADPVVAAANLRYRLAEQLERLARKRLDTIKNQIEVWRSENANTRTADQFQAREGV